jgi:hypothetical protein
MKPISLLALVSGLALSASALAQPPQPPRGQQGDPLRGPEVRDRQVPGVNGTFGEPGGEKKRFVNENKLPPRVFRDAMETVLNPEAPENLRVSDEQRTRYRGWMDDFQKSVGAYMKEHQAELAELRKNAGEPGRRPGGPKGQGQGDNAPPPPMDDNAKPRDEKDMASARERLQAVMAGAPKIEELYTRIWTELTPEQQKAVDGKLADFRARQSKEREDRYVEQKLNRKKGQPGADAPKPPQPQPPQGDQPPQRRPEGQNRGFDGGPRPGGDAPHGDGDRTAPIDPARRDRLMRMFSRLSPEQQDQLLQRLEQRMRSEGGAGGNGNEQPPQPAQNRRRLKGPQGPSEPRPAPQPDDTMMPPHPPAPPAPQQDRP